MNKGFINNAVLATLTAVGLVLTTYGLVKTYDVKDVFVAATPAQVEVTNVAPTDSKRKVKQLDLNDQQFVTVYGPIGEESYFIAKRITDLATSGKPIYVLINSPGGSVLDGALIVSAIEGSPVPVYTICEQLCASMAFIIHQYGTKRMMVDRSVLMAHPASGGVQGTLEEMNSQLSMIMRYVYKFNAYIANRAGMTPEQFHPLWISQKWIDAEDATNQKFNDQIVNIKLATVPSLPISIFDQKRRNTIKERMNIRW